MATHTKAELAAILRCAQIDLLSRDSVAVTLDRSVGTLRTKKADYPGFYKLSDANKGEVLYPAPCVRAYRKWLDDGKPGSFKGKLGAQPWPTGVDVHRDITTAEVLIMFDRWFYRYAHQKCEQTFNGQHKFEDLVGQHHKRWRLVFDGPNARKPDDPVAINFALRLVPTIAVPVVMKHEHLVTIILIKMRELLAQERRWLEQMPR